MNTNNKHFSQVFSLNLDTLRSTFRLEKFEEFMRLNIEACRQVFPIIKSELVATVREIMLRNKISCKSPNTECIMTIHINDDESLTFSYQIKLDNENKDMVNTETTYENMESFIVEFNIEPFVYGVDYNIQYDLFVNHDISIGKFAVANFSSSIKSDKIGTFITQEKLSTIYENKMFWIAHKYGYLLPDCINCHIVADLTYNDVLKTNKIQVRVITKVVNDLVESDVILFRHVFFTKEEFDRFILTCEEENRKGFNDAY